MNDQEIVNLRPLGFTPSLRKVEKRVLTSCKAGKIIPIAAVPLMRGDALNTTRFGVSVEMAETAESLFNAVHCDVRAYFVPYLAFERFNGVDDLDRAYMGVPRREGDPVEPFIEYINFDREALFWQKLGIHAPNGSSVPGFYPEAFTTLVNWRRKQRSRLLPTIERYEGTASGDSMPACFWPHNSLSHIVPDYDQAMIDGEVPLTFTSSQLPVSGITRTAGTTTGDAFVNANSSYIAVGKDGKEVAFQIDSTGASNIFAEMEENGISVSLSNIDMARKMASFAEARKKYAAHIQDENAGGDYVIDMLMSGLEVPNQALSQPILIDRKSTIFGQSTRYATDSGNLEKSVTQGVAGVELMLRFPKTNIGGIVMVTVEICPSQLYECQQDPLMSLTGTVGKDAFPNALQDFLDPEKVDRVTCGEVDARHSTPAATFGYAPLNAKWKYDSPNIGGKYYRPEVDGTFDEERQKLWSVEVADPQLTEDFYLATNLHHKVFQYANMDHFEVTARGVFPIVGLTQFGKGLHEAADDYEKIKAEVDYSVAKDDA